MALRLWPRLGAPAAARPKARAARRTLRVDALEDRTVPAAPTIDPIADVTLASNQAVRQVAIPAADADGDALTFTARAAGTEAYFLATDLGLRASARPAGAAAQGEKWFQGSGAAYFLLPSGEFHKWDGAAGPAAGPLLAALPPAFFLYPDLVTRPSSADLASLLDTRLALTVTPTPAANSLGLGEKWLAGTGGTRFYITPAGDLYRTAGSPVGANATLVAHLDPAYFNDVRLLTDSRPHPLPVQLSGAVVNVGPQAAAVGDFVVEVTARDATATARRTFRVHVANAGTPGLSQTDPQVLGAGEQVLHVPLGPTDGDGDAITYQVRAAGTQAFFLATDLGLKPDAKHRTNWGGQGERWFVGKDGWYFLKPSGDFHKWDGTSRLASGDFITTLQPVYYYYPDLLTRPQDEDLAYVLDRKLGLSPTITPAENSLGQGERWLKGKKGYFFVTPAGDLYQQGPDSPLLASLGGSYFAELNRLYAAQPDRFTATAADGTLTITTKPNYFGSFVVQVKATDGVHTTTRLVPVEQRFVAPPPGSETTDPPRVVAALSTGNKKVVVTFSQAMSNTALDPANYGIVQTNVNPEAAGVIVTGARFVDGARDAVELTTLSQSAVNYTLAVVNVRDLAGHQIAPREVSNGVVNDPSKADFAGTGPSAADRVDTDGDGLTDDQEQTGWDVQVTLVDGRVVTRGVTSDPFHADTDADGLPDAQEANLRLDPRDADTDDDQLTDAQEFNEVFSNPLSQDTDADGLDDNVEFGFFKTSPNQADTDGDQLPDGQEVVLGNRKARVADLPAPSLRVSDTRVGLDVRFTETTSTGTRLLDSKNVSSTLTQSQSKMFSNTSGSEYEVASKLSHDFGWEFTAEAGSEGASVGFKANESFGTELTTSGKWTTSNTEESTRATEEAYAQSLQTDKERTEGSELVRTVDAASLQATVFLRNLSTLGYRVKNLQLTASIQDPQDPTRLTPVATLVPDAEPADGYTLGPLGADKGPIVFSNTTIFPSLAESLMRNPRGLVFQFSNYDIVDELGRNFAFTARDVVDRTAPLVIDYGGFDSDGDGEGDFTEYKRVSTSGGRVVDTNGDGTVDAQDHRVLFDAAGQEVGITLRDALGAIGLTRYDEAATPSDSLTETQLQNSYSTRTVDGHERIFRIRKTAVTPGQNKNWEVMTATGIDRTLGLDDVILTTDGGARLAFVQDLDGDGLPANLEFLNGTSDAMKDTDGDGLDDRFELLIGWDTDVTPLGTRHVYSRPTLADTDGDGIADGTEAPSVPFDRNGDGLPDEYRRDPTDADGDGKPDDLVTDPSRADTDGDGIDDQTEVTGYDINLYQSPDERAAGVPPTVIHRTTDPTNLDTDGDTAPDGLERQLGGDPTDPGDRDKFSDSDRDGLVNVVETDGWDITVAGVSTRGFQQGPRATVHVTSDPGNPDTDGDGLLDGAEYRLFYNPSGQPGGLTAVRTNPRSADTDGDGLSDKTEALGFNLRDYGVILLDPADADTDNDRLSDGEEAELQSTEPNWWVVRVADKDPYRVFSDPRVADQDFDGLVDGDEKFVMPTDGTSNVRFNTRMSDPGKANTDGDLRNDRADVDAGLSPLEEDYKVTVAFESFYVGGNGDEGDNAGDFGFDLGVRLGDPNSPTGLSSSFQHVLQEELTLTGTTQAVVGGRSDVKPLLPVPGDPYDLDASLVQNAYYGIPFADFQGLSFAGLVPDARRTATFAVSAKSKFSIEGAVAEVDEVHPETGEDDATYVYLGGLSGLQATKADGSKVMSVFNGSDLGSQVGTVQSLTFDYGTGDNHRGKDSDDNDYIYGSVKFYYLVS